LTAFQKLKAIQKLTPGVFEKVWGSSGTEPWLANPESRKIGEVWFSAPAAMPVLVKFLFTSDRLSIQVHPDDAYARAHGHERGKTEMWHILRAEPGAIVGLGLRETAEGEQVCAAALNGEIVGMLQWIPVQAGDTLFVPAGTIHAIGGGVAICEIQQLSDVTYRLFDYHREPARPLHLKESLEVAQLVPADGRRRAVPLSAGRELLAECEHFRTELLSFGGSFHCPAARDAAIYVAIRGEGTIAGEPFRSGEAWLVPAGSEPFTIESQDAAFIVAQAPGITIDKW
jgi:mannose-6-phosphate isomerase